MYKRILVATDGSKLSNMAVEHAISLADITGAEVVALKVVPRYPQTYFEGGVALAAGLVAAPLADGLGEREVLREGVDPLLVLARQPSPLAAYRGWFTGGDHDAELFRVEGPRSNIKITTAEDFYVCRTYFDVLETQQIAGL